MENIDKNKKLQVSIKSMEGVLWEGAANSVSSENSDGKFDILPYHAQFVTLIKDKPVFVNTAGGDLRRFKFFRAVLYANEDNVFVYAEV